jgi:hypothetical protein
VLQNVRRHSRKNIFYKLVEAGFMGSKKKCLFRISLKSAGTDFACAESLNVFPVSDLDARN